MTTTNKTTTAPTRDSIGERRQRMIVEKAMKKATFATLATTSPAGLPHVAGVVYELVDGELWVHTLMSSRKARSVAATGTAAVCIPIRRLPVGPPYTIHFQAAAEIVAMDAPVVRTLLDNGKLRSISGHGALDLEDGCFLRIRPNGPMQSFGLGVRTIDIIRDPIGSGGRSIPVHS